MLTGTVTRRNASLDLGLSNVWLANAPRDRTHKTSRPYRHPRSQRANNAPVTRRETHIHQGSDMISSDWKKAVVPLRGFQSLRRSSPK